MEKVNSQLFMLRLLFANSLCAGFAHRQTGIGSLVAYIGYSFRSIITVI